MKFSLISIKNSSLKILHSIMNDYTTSTLKNSNFTFDLTFLLFLIISLWIEGRFQNPSVPKSQPPFLKGYAIFHFILSC